MRCLTDSAAGAFEGRDLDVFYARALTSVFKRFSKIEKVRIYGSRAKGNFKPNSDIDLAIEGIQNDLEVEALAMELDELPMPYKFDLKSVSGIKNQALLEHINRVGIPIYP